MRTSGILMHLSSLPGPYGIGSLGSSARQFVDFLREAGQRFWQILPLSPTGYGNSPYQALSTFAGNHYLIDLEDLISQGLLLPEEADSLCWGEDPGRVDFGLLYENRLKLLKKAFRRFRPGEAYQQFLRENQDWLPDYALFMALKEDSGGKDWLHWSSGLILRRQSALDACRTSLEPEIRFHCFLQYEFFRQWEALHAYARSRGIAIIGDVPIYVPLDSADVWSNPQLFQLDPDRRPLAVAGCPPDAFSASGQLWGNPLYRWDRLRETGYDWWIRRLRAAARLCDVVRLDHFRGFESYWAIPAQAQTAAEGHWEQGPGADFIRTIRRALPDFPCIAEDLGYLTPEVRKLQEDSGYPGMKILQFGFDSREQSNYLPHLYPVHSVCYSGTHDNLTLAQWLQEADPRDVALAKAYLGLNREEGYVAGMLRGCLGSVSELCIIQLQDYLELGARARMNFPGTLSPDNWTWRALPGSLTRELARRIRSMTARYGRLPNS